MIVCIILFYFIVSNITLKSYIVTVLYKNVITVSYHLCTHFKFQTVQSYPHQTFAASFTIVNQVRLSTIFDQTTVRDSHLIITCMLVFPLLPHLTYIYAAHLCHELITKSWSDLSE